MSKSVRLLQSALRKFGMELAPYPTADWVLARNILRNLFLRLDVACVLDVGANRGQYGSMLRDIGYHGKIVSFEPVRENFEALQECAKTRGDWSCFNFALGREDTERDINVMDEDVFSSFLNPLDDPAKRFPRNQVARTERVQIRRLDRLELPPRGIYLKMDTQGFDLEVLEGATGMLDRVVALQTELSFRPIYGAMPGYRDTLRECERRGFCVADFMPVNRESDGLRAIEMDCIMVRAPHG